LLTRLQLNSAHIGVPSLILITLLTSAAPAFAGTPALTPYDFGAVGNGTTDDTAALQSWLDRAGPGIHLALPAGTFVFSTTLTTGCVGHFAIIGVSPGVSTLEYTGKNTTIDLLEINQSTGCGGQVGITLANFSVKSSTIMTSGYAIHANGLFDSMIRDVWADNVNDGGPGTLCGGFWFHGASNINILNSNAYSRQNCGDGITVDGFLGATAELQIVGGQIGGVPVPGALEQGFKNGVHLAGGMGGVRCDELNIHNNGQAGVLIDDANIAQPNREFDEGSTCAIDSSGTFGVLVNDALANGGTVDIGGWVASTQAGPGIKIQQWRNGDVELRGQKIYNNCGSGVYIADTSTHVLINPAVAINNNGAAFGGACATWQEANPGYGVAVQTISGQSYPNVVLNTVPWNNH
jgi:hypothetical protein